MRNYALALILAALAPGLGTAGPISIATLQAFVHAGGGGSPLAQLDSSSPGFFSSLDADNLGSFGWVFSNTGLTPLTDVRLLVFLDADIDRDLNTFFNEYGEFVGLSLLSGAPLGAIAPSGWEIDEPGYVFGDIQANLQAGLLDNSNGVPSSMPDDVSLALLFSVGAVDPGRAATVNLFLSRTNIDGLHHVDPDSDSSFYFNGYASVDLAPPVGGGEVPEPGTGALVLLGGVAAAFFVRRHRN